MPPLLHANLTVSYPGCEATIRGLQLHVDRGEFAGIVGESGSGKSTLALALLRLLTRQRAEIKGSIAFRGQNLLELSESAMRSLRGRHIAFALQTAAAALNPVLRIRSQLRHAWQAHGKVKPSTNDLSALMRSVELPDDESFLARFPSQLSVGQAQRVVIAMAIMHKPELLIVDEPTSALDVVNQAKIFRLFRRLNKEHGVAIICISHDMLSVASFCERIHVMQQGIIIQSGPPAEVFHSPTTQYVKELVDAIPELGSPFRTTVQP